MCGIFGIITKEEQTLGPTLIEAGRMLSYRGYDSVGCATINLAGEIDLRKDVGKVDAVIVWDSTAAHYADSGDTIKIPRDRNVISTVAIALLGSSRNKELAGEFIDFVTSTRGQEIFRKHHFSTELPE